MRSKSTIRELESEPEARGWEAIDQALAALYGTAEAPFRCGTVTPAMLGGTDYLQGISVYRVDLPQPHWHFVTYGFSELFEKETEDAELSGFGFELTFRLLRGSEEEPPAWAINLLQNLGRYVFRSGNAFGDGHYFNCNSPIAVETNTALRAIMIAADPELPAIDTPNGRLEFLQVVGITLDELEQVQAWNAEGFKTYLNQITPWLITDLDRESSLSNSHVANAMIEKARAEGSSCGVLFVAEVDFVATPRKLKLIVGANGIRSWGPVLRGRVPFGRPFTLVGSGKRIAFEVGDNFQWREKSEQELEVTLPKQSCEPFLAMFPIKAGTYTDESLPALTVEIKPSQIRNEAGDVVEVIG